MTVFEVTGEVNYAPQVVRVAELTTLVGEAKAQSVHGCCGCCKEGEVRNNE